MAKLHQYRINTLYLGNDHDYAVTGVVHDFHQLETMTDMTFKELEARCEVWITIGGFSEQTGDNPSTAGLFNLRYRVTGFHQHEQP